ncbi:phosphopantetheine-binding protein [uncultured Rothia sp.]|uniref:phosphopantetheine-binding protein n=1 Tax=uncultured Rothia sp. TaxID=316088 RepID=UPI0025E4147E|nr:phosphopantetheine-binding protein [uncultured Rothia sp.]
MSALETLRPIMERYLLEADSLQTAFDEPTTDLFSLGLDSMGSFALLDDLAAEGAVIEFTELVENPTVEFLASRLG